LGAGGAYDNHCKTEIVGGVGRRGSRLAAHSARATGKQASESRISLRRREPAFAVPFASVDFEMAGGPWLCRWTKHRYRISLCGWKAGATTVTSGRTSSPSR